MGKYIKCGANTIWLHLHQDIISFPFMLKVKMFWLPTLQIQQLGQGIYLPL